MESQIISTSKSSNLNWNEISKCRYMYDINSPHYQKWKNYRYCEMCELVKDITNPRQVKVSYRKGIAIPTYYCINDGRQLRTKPRNRGQSPASPLRKQLSKLDSRPK